MHNKKNIVIVVIVSLALLGLGIWYFGGEKLKRVQRLQGAMSSGFEYYGKVVDQHGEPVSGVEVYVGWGYFPFIPNGDFGPSHKNLTFTTDKEGRFSIKKSKGMSLSINDFRKDGYEFRGRKGYMFSSGGYKMLQSFSDPNKPVIFHAWKKTEAEPLVFVERAKYRYSFDSSPYTINLLTNKSMKGRGKGDLIVSFWRDPNASRSDAGDWRVSLEAVGGGLIESNEIFMNDAPEDGYQRHILLSHKKIEDGYVSRADKKYFLKSRNGQVYARLEMQIRPYYNDRESVIIMKYWLNPNGSRNLQYDPSKRIYPK